MLTTSNDLKARAPRLSEHKRGKREPGPSVGPGQRLLPSPPTRQIQPTFVPSRSHNRNMCLQEDSVLRNLLVVLDLLLDTQPLYSIMDVIYVDDLHVVLLTSTLVRGALMNVMVELMSWHRGPSSIATTLFQPQTQAIFTKIKI